MAIISTTCPLKADRPALKALIDGGWLKCTRHFAVVPRRSSILETNFGAWLFISCWRLGPNS
jgi:hypothetical protein